MKSHTIRYPRKRILRWSGSIVVIMLITGFAFYHKQYDNLTLSGSGMASNPDTSIKSEKEAPSYYLNISGRYHTNFMNQLVINGLITNIAKQTNYKSVVVRVRFFSNAQTEIDSKTYMIDKEFPFGFTRSFTLKMIAPLGTKMCTWEVEKAMVF